MDILSGKWRKRDNSKKLIMQGYFRVVREQAKIMIIDDCTESVQAQLDLAYEKEETLKCTMLKF